MKLHTINTGFFKLDGGAMFGTVPKTLWNRLNPADDNNMCTWAMRCLLIEDGDRLILIDNGIGSKQDDKFFGHYYLHGEDSLKKSLAKLGFGPEQITDVFLTHLHFDHCGGGVEWNKDRTKFQLTFPNATYWSNTDHWNYALNANPREKASFLKENLLPIDESGHLQFVDIHSKYFTPSIEVFFADGHTGKMMVPIISYKGKRVIFCADLIPSTSHIPVNYVMGYDVRPLLTMDEKQKLLENAIDMHAILFFEHDPTIECATVQKTEKGFKLLDSMQLKEI